MMATAFLGYVLPWGQMSYWGATVITNLFSTIPLVGDTVVSFLLGGYSVGNPTLNRFFSLHYLLPFMIVGVVILHIWALHVPGRTTRPACRSSPARMRCPSPPMRPLKTCSQWRCSWWPRLVGVLPPELSRPRRQLHPGQPGGHALPHRTGMVLPTLYAILRAIPDKLGGVIAMFGSIAVLAFLPWLDTSKVRSTAYRPLYKQFFWVFVAVCVLLGWLGSKPAEGHYVLLARIARSTTSPISSSCCRWSASSRSRYRCRTRSLNR